MLASPSKLKVTARQVVETAVSQHGYVERGVNRTKYGEAYGWNGVAYCGIGVWWCFNEHGVDLRKLGVPNPASTNDFDASLRRLGWQRVPPKSIRYGDIVFEDFGVTGPGDPADDDDHVEIARSSALFGYFSSTGFNTSSGAKGSQANGGGVWPRRRPISVVRHVYRPPYSTAKELAARPAARRKAVLARPKPKSSTRAKVGIGAGVALGVIAGGGGTAAVTSPGDPLPRPAVTVTVAPAPQVCPATRAKPVAVPRPRFTRELALRPEPYMSGPDVAEVQRDLLRLKGKAIDREFGPATSRGLKGWQKRHGLPPSGRFTRATARKAGWRVS